MKNIITVLFLLITINTASGIDLSDFGDFSSRSVIMNTLSGNQTANQEQKDKLKEKKLTASTSCLIEQIKKGDIDNINLLLESKVDPNKSYMSDYPVYIAAKNNKTDIVKLLVNKGAKLDKGFYSELYEAVRNKNKELAQFLLDNNARVNYTDSITNNTILSLALKNNMNDIASQLIKKGAKADFRSVKLIKKKKLQYLIEK